MMRCELQSVLLAGQEAPANELRRHSDGTLDPTPVSAADELLDVRKRPSPGSEGLLRQRIHTPAGQNVGWAVSYTAKGRNQRKVKV